MSSRESRVEQGSRVMTLSFEVKEGVSKMQGLGCGFNRQTQGMAKSKEKAWHELCEIITPFISFVIYFIFVCEVGLWLFYCAL